jgi:hypothetical protein
MNLHRRPIGALCVAAVCAAAGCSSSTAAHPVSIAPPFSGVLAATCVVADPPARPQVSGPAGGAASDGRFTRAVSLDKANLMVSPPPANAKPAISARLAECNLRASKAAEGLPVEEETQLTGLTFGLATVSVRDSVLTAPPLYTVTGSNLPTPPALHAYHQRLAWVAILRPQIPSSCPAMTTAPPRPKGPLLPGYEVLVIDANTGAYGFVYTAARNGNCDPTTIEAPTLSAAVEEVSVPWTLVSRGSDDGYSAVINVAARTCDGVGDGNGAFNASRDVSGLVTTQIQRPLNACGPTGPQRRTLQASTVSATLPAHLVHGPLGAVDQVP